jgi:hypothetical protein
MTLSLLLLLAALQGTDRVTCNPQLQWIVKADQPMEISKSAVTQLSFFSSLGVGCGTADIRLTAVYTDSSENVVCSGTIAGIISQSDGTQFTMIEVRPSSLFEFVRWRSGPRNISLLWRSLICARPDGMGNVQLGELDRGTSLRLYATILPGGGGVATEMLRAALVP